MDGRGSAEAAETKAGLELSIVMPCLNEAETIATCIRKAKSYLQDHGITGEVLVADNGSTDGSATLAAGAGARVVAIARRGYGAALLGGLEAARGTFVIMGDADDSYDFTALQPFVERLRAGADLVIGNRFKGGIAPGAMPFLHRYLGNPVLSWLGRLFFKLRIGDFHCGLRGFARERMIALNLRTTGMEFASEMIVRAALAGYLIDEVPTTLQPDGRGRRSHLRTWRDGWRHLSFLLTYSPRWLFFYPGLFFLSIGLASSLLLFRGPFEVGGVEFDVHTFLVTSFFVLLGMQAVAFAAFTRRFGTAHGLLPASKGFTAVMRIFTPERLLAGGGILIAAGGAGLIACTAQWASTGFGPLDYAGMLRTLVLSLMGLSMGVQIAFTAFMLAILDIPTK